MPSISLSEDLWKMTLSYYYNQYIISSTMPRRGLGYSSSANIGFRLGYKYRCFFSYGRILIHAFVIVNWIWFSRNMVIISTLAFNGTIVLELTIGNGMLLETDEDTDFSYSVYIGTRSL